MIDTRASIRDLYKHVEIFRRKRIMSNIKITADVDGKHLTLETISTETFEAIKALEKPKEIPVARVGHYRDIPSDRRLFLKITDSIKRCIVENDVAVIAIELKNGWVANSWAVNDKRLETLDGSIYENVKSL